MDRIDALAEKIDAALRNDASGGAVFDMLPAWVEEFKQVHERTPGTSGGTFPLDHYMHESEMSDFDALHTDNGRAVGHIGRAIYQCDEQGIYGVRLVASVADAEAEVADAFAFYPPE